MMLFNKECMSLKVVLDSYIESRELMFAITLGRNLFFLDKVDGKIVGTTDICPYKKMSYEYDMYGSKGLPIIELSKRVNHNRPLNSRIRYKPAMLYMNL